MMNYEYKHLIFNSLFIVHCSSFIVHCSSFMLAIISTLAHQKISTLIWAPRLRRRYVARLAVRSALVSRPGWAALLRSGPAGHRFTSLAQD